MVVKFNKDCQPLPMNRPTDPFPICACDLLFGTFHKVTTYDAPNEATRRIEIQEGMNANGKQILLTVQRHGRSHFNEANEAPETKGDKKGASIMTETFVQDSPLWPNGILDAVRLNNRLSYPEDITAGCNTCTDDTECSTKRHCSSVYTARKS